MPLLTLSLLLALTTSTSAIRAEALQAQALGHRIISTKDIGFGVVRRFQVKVSLPEPYAREKVEQIAKVAEFAIAYAPDDLSFDDQAFWKQNVGYGKIYPVPKSVYVQAGLSRERSEQAVNWHKGWKNELSGAVHGAAWSAFQCAIVPSLESPGMGVAKALGHLSAHTPALCKVVLDEVSLFSEVFLHLLHSKAVPDNLKGLGAGSELASTLAAADTFKALFAQLVDELVPDRNTLFREPNEASGEHEEAQPQRAGA
jgi:hypothetical protein